MDLTGNFETFGIQHTFEVYQPIALRLDRERNVYQYTVRSSRDIQDRRGTTRVFFGADTGAFKLLLLPSGQYDGNTVTSWLYALHMGNVLGLPWRIFVCIIGLIIVMLSVTGIIIWSKNATFKKAKTSPGNICAHKNLPPCAAHWIVTGNKH